MRGAAALLVALAAAGCSEEKPTARTVPLSQSAEGRRLLDAGVGNAVAAKKAAAAAALDQAAVEEPEPESGGEPVLPAGVEWLSLPGLGVDVGVAPAVRVARAAGGEVVLSDGTDEARVRRAAGAWDRDAVVKRLTREAGGPVGVVVDRAEKDDVRLEYVVKDRKSGAPIYGLVMRREIEGKGIECASRGPRTNSTFMALETCRRMRATPR